MKPQFKHLREDTVVGKGVPLRAQRVTNDLRTVLTIRVRIGKRGVASVLNGISSPGHLEIPLRNRESSKITTAKHLQLGCWNRWGAKQ